MNYSSIPAEALNCSVISPDGEHLRLAQLISITTQDSITDFSYSIINSEIVGFWFTTADKKYTLINTSAGSYFLEVLC